MNKEINIKFKVGGIPYKIYLVPEYLGVKSVLIIKYHAYLTDLNGASAVYLMLSNIFDGKILPP